MQAAELHARKVEKEEPLRAELMNIHSTPGLEAAEQAAVRPDYTPAPMTEAERSSHEKIVAAMTRAQTPSREETAEDRFVKYMKVQMALAARMKGDANPHPELTPEDYAWAERYETTPECRTRKCLYAEHGDTWFDSIRARCA
jgi:hypothetical protein